VALQLPLVMHHPLMLLELELSILGIGKPINLKKIIETGKPFFHHNFF
jgi:hypothetical protein